MKIPKKINHRITKGTSNSTSVNFQQELKAGTQTDICMSKQHYGNSQNMKKNPGSINR